MATLPVSGRNAPGAAKVPEYKQLYCAPILACGNQADLLVMDAGGEPIAGANVKVNEEVITTDSTGHAAFTVPQTEELTIVPERSSGSAGRHKYVRSGNLLVVQSLSTIIADALCEDYTPKNGKAPRLLFAPGVIQPGKDFVVTGVRFPGSTSENRLYVDGREAEVLASSTVSLVARAPAQLHAGAIREIYVSCNGINSNTCETDVCKIDFSWPETPDPDGAPQEAKLSVLGTFMPSVVEVVNRSNESVSFWLPDQKPMGKRGIFLTPGGENNSIAMQIKRSGTEEPKVETELIPEVPTGTPGEHSDIISAATRHALCKAQLIRLQRRLIAVQARIEESRKSSDADEKQSEALLVEMRELSLRQNRIQNMLESRRALLVALGGSEDEYRQTIDDASGKILANIELKIQLPQVSVDAVSSPSPPRDVAETISKKPRGRLHRFIEPVIRLLPPMSQEELDSISRDGSASSSGSTAGPGSSLTGMQEDPIAAKSPGTPTTTGEHKATVQTTTTIQTTTTVTTGAIPAHKQSCEHSIKSVDRGGDAKKGKTDGKTHATVISKGTKGSDAHGKTKAPLDTKTKHGKDRQTKRQRLSGELESSSTKARAQKHRNSHTNRRRRR